MKKVPLAKSPSQTHIINEFGGNKLRIDITGPVWRAPHHGVIHKIDWERLGLSPEIVNEVQPWVADKLRKRSPGYISRVATVLRQLGRAIGPNKTSLLQLEIEDWNELWLSESEDTLGVLRQLYEHVVARTPYAEDAVALADTLATWMLRASRTPSAGVASWTPDQGAYVTTERETICSCLHSIPDDVSDGVLVASVYQLILMETGRRGVQVTSIRADGLEYSEADDTYYVRVPGGKAQSGQPARRYPVSHKTAQRACALSQRPAIAQLQRLYNRLLICPTENLPYTCELSIQQLQVFGTPLFRMMKSPRTQQTLRVAPRRARHDFGTRLARDGASSQEIRVALEHAEEETAKTYLDATGADFVAALSKVDATTGGLLKDLASAYKSGAVASQGSAEVCLPESAEALVVGSCARKEPSSCYLPRFYSCYGCVFFKPSASTEVHEKSLLHVEAVRQRWLGHEALSAWVERTIMFEKLTGAIEQVLDVCEGTR